MSLTCSSWGSVLKRTVTEFREDNVTDLAAALTYYGLLAIFPALIALVSILGLIGHSATQPLLESLDTVAPSSARSVVSNAIENIERDRAAAGVVFVVAVASALWSASGYVGAFMRASNRIYDIEEGRPIWKTLPVRIGVTAVTALLLTLTSVSVVLTGALAKQVGKLLGVGSGTVTIWDIAKWPVLLVVVSFVLAILYWAAPNVRHRGFRWIGPGALLALGAWLIASGAFALYVANFSSYNKTYGSLAAIVVFLVWLWISNVAVLLGAQLNAELERERLIQAGHPADREPFAQPRDTRGMKRP